MIDLFLIKEVKKYPLFFFLLIITLFLGSLGLIGISVVSDQVKNKLALSARELLTSDLAINARRELTPKELELVEGIVQKYQFDRYKVIDIYSMVLDENSKQTRLVEIRGIEPSFPFYGRITTDSGPASFSDSLLISSDLALLWDVKKGSLLKVGNLRLIAGDIVRQDTSIGLRGFSLAPRIYMPLTLLNLSGLLRPGSTGSFAYHYHFKNISEMEIKKIRDRVLNAIPDKAVRVTLPEDSSEQNGRVLNYLTDFMSLAALIGLLLSLVGVFYLYQSQLIARLKDLCLLHLMGIDKKKIAFGIVLQFSLVFITVFLFQLIFLVPGNYLLAPTLSKLIGIELRPQLNLGVALSQMPFLYILILSVLVPLLMGLMRTQMGVQLKASKVSMGVFHFFDFIPFALILWGFSCYLSHSFRTGSIFFFGLIVIFVLSSLLIYVFKIFLAALIKQTTLLNPNIETGIALRNILRSGHRLTLSFLSLALSATLISLILQLDKLIQSEFVLDEGKPSLFLFDIQEDQIEGVEKFALKRGVKLEGITPLIRARLEKINGKVFERSMMKEGLRTREDEVEGRFKNRGINLTYRSGLGVGEKIVEGAPFPQIEDKETAWVSLEKRYAQRMGIKLGDTLSFDIQGVEVEGKVLNFREVKWTSFYPNFFVNFSPGQIDLAPKTYLAVFPQVDGEIKTNFQRDAVIDFPNISFIDVEEIIGRLSQLFEKSRQAIELISWLSLGVGLIILYGLFHDQVYRRTYDLALMKALGVSVKSLTIQLLVEFGLIFFLAMASGFALGWLMAVVIAQEVFKISWSIDWLMILFPILFLTLLCLMTILLVSRKAVRAKPRELLAEN